MMCRNILKIMFEDHVQYCVEDDLEDQFTSLRERGTSGNDEMYVVDMHFICVLVDSVVFDFWIIELLVLGIAVFVLHVRSYTIVFFRGKCDVVLMHSTVCDFCVLLLHCVRCPGKN
jgi:hypothetical protein